MLSATRDTLHGHRLYTTLDGMRAMASLLVVSRHVTPLFGPAARDSYLAVDLFFLMSGFVIANAYEGKLLDGMGKLAFARVRAVRLYPIYALGVAAGVVASWLAHDLGAAGLAVHGLLSALLIPNPDPQGGLFPVNGPAWSLFFEAVVNASYVLLLRVIVGKRLPALLALCLAGLAACLALHVPHTLDLGWKVQTFPVGLLRVAFSFYAGVFILRLHARHRGRSPEPRHGNAVPVALVACVAGLLAWSPPEVIAPFVDLLSIACVFPAVLWLSLRHQPVGTTAKAFRIGGLASYAIYALHAPLGSIVAQALAHVQGLDIASTVPWSGYAFLVLLAPTCLLVDAIYDAPLRKALGRRLAPRRVAPRPEGDVRAATTAR